MSYLNYFVVFNTRKKIRLPLHNYYLYFQGRIWSVVPIFRTIPGLVFKHFDKLTKYTYVLKYKFSSFERLDLNAWCCTMLNYMCNISMIFFFSAAFKVNLPYHCKIHFHIHTHTHVRAHAHTHAHTELPLLFFLYFLFPWTPLCMPLPIPLTFFWCSLLRKSSKTERFNTIWISMKF